MADIALTIQVADGKREKVTAPPDINTQEFIDQLVEGLSLATVNGNGNGHQTAWRLVDLSTGREMQPEKSLWANHVTTGQLLVLDGVEAATATVDEPEVAGESAICPRCVFRNEPGTKFCRSCGSPLAAREPDGDIEIFIHTADGRTEPCELPASFPAGDLVGQVLGLPVRGKWTLYDKESGRDLNPLQTLAENQVLNGHNIYLREVVVGGELDKGDKGKDQGKTVPPTRLSGKVIGIIAAVLMLALGAGYGAAWYLARIAVTPSGAALTVPASQQFQAISRGKPVEVVWSIAPALGNITPSGVYSSPRFVPNPVTIRITATRGGLFGSSASTDIVLQPGREQVDVAPETASLEGGATSQFSAKVTGGMDSAVRWTIQPELGTISAEGLYTAPAMVADQAIVEVKAASAANPDRFATAHVTLEPVAVTLQPATATLQASSSLRITSTVSGSAEHGLRWSLLGPGSVSRTGVYSAPGDLTAPATAQVTATSIANPGKSASVSISIRPVVSVAVTPASGVLVASQRLRFSATVGGTLKTGVRWTLNGPGSISQDGEYQAPASVPAVATARLTAVSDADSSKTAEATVTLRPITLSITPSEVELKSSQTTWLIANVSSGGNLAVRWTLSGPGSISPQGIYSAPALVRQDTVVRATATSLVDPSRSATAVIKLKRYNGLMSGVLIWTGTTEKNGTVTIDGNSVDRGALRGDPFPALPVTVSLDTKDFTVVQGPAPSNGWKKLQMSNKKGKSTTVKIFWKIVLEGDTNRPN